MLLIPAVDVRGGRCVRLTQGRPDQETEFSDDPVAMARRWADAGAPRLHVVDLDGAFAGAPRQLTLVEKIAAEVAPIPIQVGGGLRDSEAVAAALAAGATWVVLGTRAVLDEAFLVRTCRAHPHRVIVAVDGHGSRLAVKGWTERTGESVFEAGARAARVGAAALLFTDITRDGTGTGPNLPDTETLAATVEVPVFASGGVGSVADLRRVAQARGVAGIVVGKALYTGAIDLAEALQELGRPCSRNV